MSEQLYIATLAVQSMQGQISYRDSDRKIIRTDIITLHATGRTAGIAATKIANFLEECLVLNIGNVAASYYSAIEDIIDELNKNVKTRTIDSSDCIIHYTIEPSSIYTRVL
jgi:hypothetical protein